MMIANKIESYVQCGNCNQSVCHRSEAHHHKDRTDFEEPFMPSLCINQKIVKNQSELDVNSFFGVTDSLHSKLLVVIRFLEHCGRLATIIFGENWWFGSASLLQKASFNFYGSDEWVCDSVDLGDGVGACFNCLQHYLLPHKSLQRPVSSWQLTTSNGNVVRQAISFSRLGTSFWFI